METLKSFVTTAEYAKELYQNVYEEAERMRATLSVCEPGSKAAEYYALFEQIRGELMLFADFADSREELALLGAAIAMNAVFEAQTNSQAVVGSSSQYVDDDEDDEQTEEATEGTPELPKANASQKHAGEKIILLDDSYVRWVLRVCDNPVEATQDNITRMLEVCTVFAGGEVTPGDWKVKIGVADHRELIKDEAAKEFLTKLNAVITFTKPEPQHLESQVIRKGRDFTFVRLVHDLCAEYPKATLCVLTGSPERYEHLHDEGEVCISYNGCNYPAW